MPACAQPKAPWVKCCICQKKTKTCERRRAIKNDYRCPAHPDGAELASGKWVCSFACWDIAVGPIE